MNENDETWILKLLIVRRGNTIRTDRSTLNWRRLAHWHTAPSRCHTLNLSLHVQVRDTAGARLSFCGGFALGEGLFLGRDLALGHLEAVRFLGLDGCLNLLQFGTLITMIVLFFSM